MWKKKKASKKNTNKKDNKKGTSRKKKLLIGAAATAAAVGVAVWSKGKETDHNTIHYVREPPKSASPPKSTPKERKIEHPAPPKPVLSADEKQREAIRAARERSKGKKLSNQLMV